MFSSHIFWIYLLDHFSFSIQSYDLPILGIRTVHLCVHFFSPQIWHNKIHTLHWTGAEEIRLFGAGKKRNLKIIIPIGLLCLHFYKPTK